MKKLIEEWFDIKLSPDEEISTFKNEYSEYCYIVINRRTGEVVKQGAF